MSKVSNLSNQDAHYHSELMQSTKCSTKRCWWHLPHVHGSQPGEETAEQANDQTTRNHHLIGGADGGEPHEEASDHSQDVHQEHGAPSEERKSKETLNGQKHELVLRKIISGWGLSNL